MLEFQTQQYAFRYGLAEGTDPRQVPPGTLTTAENCVWKQSGRVEKRFGITAVTSPGAGAIARLFTRGSELCVASDAGLYGFGSGASTWESKGKLPNVGVTWETAIDTAGGVQASDMSVSAAGIEVRAWVTGDPTSTSVSATSDLFVEIVDRATGNVLASPPVVAGTNAFGVRVLIIGTTAIILTRRTSASPFTLYAATFSLTTFLQTGASTLRSDVATTSTFSGWDACVVGSNFVVAYNRTGAIVALESYNTSLASQASGTISGEAAGLTMVSITGGTLGSSLYVAYERAGATPRAVRVAIANSATLAQTVAPVTLETTTRSLEAITACEFDSTHCVLAYAVRESDNSKRMTTVRVSNAAVADGATIRSTWFAYPLTRPFLMAGRCFIAALGWNSLAADSTFGGFTSGLFEVEFTDRGPYANVPHRLVGKIDPITGGMIPFAAPRPEPAAISATMVATMLPFLSSAAPAVTNWRCGTRKLTVTLGADRAVDWGRAFASGSEAFVAGSGLVAYDGRSVFDYGFFQSPDISVSTSAAGGNILAGAYLYGAVEEFRSATGLLYRSPTAIGASKTTTGTTSTNTVIVSTSGISLKQTLSSLFSGSVRPSRCATYRSTVNGLVYQRLAYEPGFNVLDADLTQAFLTLTDKAPDTDITNGLGTVTPLGGRPALYTTGGILDDYQPPASVTMFHHADRLWVLAGDRRTWWYSKAFQDDLGTAPGFNPAFLIAFDDVQTAGATMDDKAIFFSATGVRYMLGTGPAPNGQNSDFTPPVVIQSDVGCTNARSVVGTPDGVMFQSDRGIYLLTRGLELVWIGRPVKETLAAYPVITSATLVAKQNLVRFTCNAADGLTGVVIAYDYVEKQWSTAKYHDGTTYGCAIADACMWNGAWTFATPAGLVFTESTTSYLDGSRYVPMTLETAWIAASGPLAFQSVRTFNLHGQSATDHDLTVQVGFDSETAYVQTATFAATGAVTAVGVEEAEVSIGTRRKCNTIRFKISDATPSAGAVGTGRGPAFDMMGLEVGIKRGFGNNPATKRA